MAASSETAPQCKRARHFRLAALMVSFSCLTAAITILPQLLLVDHYAIEHASDQARLRLQQLSWQMRDSLDRTLDQEVRDVYQLFLDMDGFKQINDTRGHEEGDELLRQFGTRIVHGIREADLAARLAGDEFVVILDMLNDELDAAEKGRCPTERAVPSLWPDQRQRAGRREHRGLSADAISGPGSGAPAGTGRAGDVRGQAQGQEPGRNGARGDRTRRHALAVRRRWRKNQTPQRTSVPWSRAARSISSSG
jgi:GGDEF domain-containing protein